MSNFKFLIIFFLFFSILLVPVVVEAEGYAQTQLSAAAGTQGAQFGQAKDPRAIMATVIQVILGMMGILFTAYLVYGGFLMLTSRGEEEKITKGRKILQWGVIGMFVIFSAYSAVLFVDRYMKKAQDTGEHTGPFYTEFEFTTDEDTSEFSNPDPLYEKNPAGDAWKGTDWSQW